MGVQFGLPGDLTKPVDYLRNYVPLQMLAALGLDETVCSSAVSGYELEGLYPPNALSDMRRLRPTVFVSSISLGVLPLISLETS